MANPGNKGVGTGTAVLFDPTQINKSTAKVFDDIGQAYKEKRARGDVEKAKRSKAEAEAEGRLGEYDPTKLRISDADPAKNMYLAIKKKYAGHYGDVLKGSPEWANAYAEDIANFKNFVAKSASTKSEMQDLYGKVTEVDSGYSPERQAAIKKSFEQPGFTLNDAKELGFYQMDTVVGDPLSRVDDAFKDSGNELYIMSEGSYINKNNEKVAYDKKNWLPDDEALPKFKKTVTSSPRLMSDMNIMYPDMDNDDKIQAFYDDYKTSRETEKNDYDRGRAPKESGGSGFGGKQDKYDFAIGTEKVRKRGGERGEMTDSDVITIGKKSGAALSPITIDGVVSVVSEIKKNSSGEWQVSLNTVKDDMGTMTITGETTTLPLNKTVKTHLESEYGIKDVPALAKKLKAEKSGTRNEGDTWEDGTYMYRFANGKTQRKKK